MGEVERLNHLRCRLTSIGLLLILIGVTSSVALAMSDPSGGGPKGDSSVRFEVLPVANGADLITLFFREQASSEDPFQAEIPLLSVLRDTLGNPDPQVHRLRYLWMHTSATPSLRQRLAAATPFMYNRFGNAGAAKGRVPSPALDLFAEDHLWKSIWQFALKTSAFDPRISLVDTMVRTYRQNQSSYMKAQFARASTALEMDDPHADLTILSAPERMELQSQLAQRSKTLAGILNPPQLERFYVKRMLAMRQDCARNWELLRQRAEAEGLYFEPLLLPDGTATHVLLMVAKEDLQEKHKAAYNDRFLSIGSPWGDKALLNWKGPVETRYYDSQNRRVASETSGGRRVELIPLALYGLDHPRIPALLIDFRKPFSAKQRELSRQALKFGARLSTNSGFANLMLMAGRTAVGIFSRRTGMDLLQPTRALSYSQLKMVLSVNPGLSPEMRGEIARRMEHVAVNPLENDVQAEARIARNQYTALVEYARQPNGLPNDLDRDRRKELIATNHGSVPKFFFRLTDVLTFGVYTHREPQKPGLEASLESQRRNSTQTAFLRDVVKSGSRMDVAWDLSRVRRTLQDLGAEKSVPDDEVAELAFDILVKSRDTETQQQCLDTLLGIDNESARRMLLRVAQDQTLDMKWRVTSASHLGISIQTPTAAAPPSSGGAND